jgi:hypothetical protein
MRFACLAALLLGCSGGSFDVAGGGADASVDSSASDTGAPPEDTATDTTVPDSPVADALQPDGPVDGGSVDAADTAPLCPQHASTKEWDVTSFSDCGILRMKYVDAVAGAKPCTCDADCSEKIDPNLCGCTTYVSPANDAYPLAIALAARYEKRGCVTTCPAIPCKPVTTSKCVATVTGMQCQDL